MSQGHFEKGAWVKYNPYNDPPDTSIYNVSTPSIYNVSGPVGMTGATGIICPTGLTGQPGQVLRVDKNNNVDWGTLYETTPDNTLNYISILLSLVIFTLLLYHLTVPS